MSCPPHVCLWTLTWQTGPNKEGPIRGSHLGSPRPLVTPYSGPVCCFYCWYCGNWPDLTNCLLYPSHISWKSYLNIMVASTAGTQGRNPRDFPRAQAIFHPIPWLKSLYIHSQLPLITSHSTITSHWGLLRKPNMRKYWGLLRKAILPRWRGESIVTIVFLYYIVW